MTNHLIARFCLGLRLICIEYVHGYDEVTGGRRLSEVLARLRAGPRTSVLPVIVLSSSSKDEDVVTAYRSGCNGYLLKGVDYRNFVEAAQAAVQYWLVHNVVAKGAAIENRSTG